MESLVPEPEAVSALAEVLSLDDIDMLLCLRLSSQTDAATSLGLTVSEFDARFRAFSSRVRRLGQRVMSAVRWVLRGRVLFLSSTYSDLKEHREAIIVKLHRLAANGLPIVVLAMEHLLPGRGHPGGRCIEWVRRSDVYIGVFGMRYGSIWKDRGIGFTEAELREAERIDLERCLYVSHESCDMPHDAGDSDKKERIEALRGELSARYVVGFFVSPRDVAEQIGDKVATMFWS
jgi:hypothetical protein